MAKECLFSPEDLEAWKADPLSQWVLKALRTQAEACRSEWVETTWGSQLSGAPGAADQALLIELKARADSYLAVEEATYQRICEIHGEIPITE